MVIDLASILSQVAFPTLVACFLAYIVYKQSDTLNNIANTLERINDNINTINTRLDLVERKLDD